MLGAVLPLAWAYLTEWFRPEPLRYRGNGLKIELAISDANVNAVGQPTILSRIELHEPDGTSNVVQLPARDDLHPLEMLNRLLERKLQRAKEEQEP